MRASTYIAVGMISLLGGSLLNNATAADANFNLMFDPVQTDLVGLLGDGKSATRTDPIPDAPAGSAIDQASIQVSSEFGGKPDLHTCDLVFGDWVEFVPGIWMPRKLSVTANVHVGGLLHARQRASIKCSVSGRYLPVPTKEDRTSAPAGADANAVMPTIPVSIALERQARSEVTAGAPLDALVYIVTKNADLQMPKLPLGGKLTLIDFRFEDYAKESPRLGIYADVDLSGGPIGFRCGIHLHVALPAAKLQDIKVQLLDSTTDCRSGAAISDAIDLKGLIRDAASKAISDAIAKPLAGNLLSDWSKQDPELSAFLDTAMVQGLYCDVGQKPSLCVRAAWSDPTSIDNYEKELLAKAPAKTGPADDANAVARRDEFRAIALKNHMASANGVSYPSAFDGGHVSDGDMAIFGGLLCRSGEEEGCKLLQNASSADGRFWRSPARIGTPDEPGSAAFSGDQTKGVLNYFIVKNDVPRLKAFLDYVKSQKIAVPGSDLVLLSGYSDCPNGYPNFTCLIGDDAWFALKKLATKDGLATDLPSDLPTIEVNYGFNYDTLVWTSLFVNSGYRLHLIANTIWILRGLGETDPRLAEAAAILAARQPKNPFFLYLHLGADRQVQALADQKCEFPITHTDFSDWAWQRAETDQAWQHSMVWDCVFIYRLLAGDDKKEIPQ